MYPILRNSLLQFSLLMLISAGACGDPPADASTTVPASPVTEKAELGTPAVTNDVIAKVGDQDITYRQLSTMLNSSAVVGVSVPALGTPQRVKVLIMLLDKEISVDLLYLDALKQGVDREPGYKEDLKEFSDALLAGLYQKQLLANVVVSDDEVDAYIKESLKPDAQVTDDMRAAIKASLHKRKYTEHQASLRDQLREGVTVTITAEKLNPKDDSLRNDADVLATIDKQQVTWGESRRALQAASERAQLSHGVLDPVAERREVLNRLIDSRIMTQKGKAAGLEQDPAYQTRYNEYRKSHLVNLHRHELLEKMAPSEEEVTAYYKDHQQEIGVPEQRKIQMVVLKSREEAEAVKQKIESGEITIYQAAEQFSIDPKAKQTLGEMDWVTKGTGFPALDEVTFSLAPNEIGGPVESPAGWHLVKVLDMREARNQDVQDEKTRKLTRRTIMRNRQNDYVVKLRTSNAFPVVVYNDRINELAKQEADWIAALEKKAQKASSLTKKREEEYKEYMQQP